MKGTLNSCKLKLSLREKAGKKLYNMFIFKDCIPYDLVSGVVFKHVIYAIMVIWRGN